MIKRLRTKFVLIIMVLVGAVLAGVLGGTLISTWQSQRDITIEALERGIEGNMFDRPRWGINELVEREEGGLTLGKPPEHGKTNLFVLTVDLDADGIVLATNDAPVVLDGAVMQQVLDEALSSDEDMGWDTSIHIAWMRAERAFGTWRVVICDTSAQDLTMRTLIVRNLVIITIAMLLLLAIAIGLSTWVLRPVEEAWEQQRRFVADASHELKTPLAVISANTQILMADDGIPKESRRWVESTRDEATHMKGLVEELLELARTDETQAGGSVMHNERVDMSSLVESSALEFDAIAYERGRLQVRPGLRAGVRAAPPRRQEVRPFRQQPRHPHRRGRPAPRLRPLLPQRRGAGAHRVRRRLRARARDRSGHRPRPQGRDLLHERRDVGHHLHGRPPLCLMSAHADRSDATWSGPAIGLLDLDAFFASVEQLERATRPASSASTPRSAPWRREGAARTPSGSGATSCATTRSPTRSWPSSATRRRSLSRCRSTRPSST